MIFNLIRFCKILQIHSNIFEKGLYNQNFPLSEAGLLFSYKIHSSQSNLSTIHRASNTKSLEN